MTSPSLKSLKGLIFFVVLTQVFAPSVFSTAPADWEISAQGFAPVISPDSLDLDAQDFSESEDGLDSGDFLMSEEPLSLEEYSEEEIAGEEVPAAERTVTQSEIFQINRVKERKDKYGRTIYFMDEIRDRNSGALLYLVARSGIRYDSENQIIRYSETFKFPDKTTLTGKFLNGEYEIKGTLQTLALGGLKQSLRLRYELGSDRLLIHTEARAEHYEGDLRIVSLGKFSRQDEMMVVRYYEYINSRGETTQTQERFFDLETEDFLYLRKRIWRKDGYNDTLAYPGTKAKLSLVFRDGIGFLVKGRLEDLTPVNFKYLSYVDRGDLFYAPETRQFLLLNSENHAVSAWDLGGNLIEQGAGISVPTEIPSLINQGSLSFSYFLDGVEHFQTFSNLAEGENRLLLKAYDAAGRLNLFYFEVSVDTIPPRLMFYDFPETDILDVGLFVFRYKVSGALEPAEETYRVVTLEAGDNDIVFSFQDAAGNIAERHFQIRYLAADETLSLEEKILRQRYMETELQYFLNPLGVDAASGFPIDMIGTNAPAGIYWTQPTSIGQYLNVLGNILLSRFDTSSLSFEDALERLQNTVNHLLDVQKRFGWKGLIPWLRLEGTIRPDRTTYNLVDNANLTHQIASLMGQLEKGNLHRSLAQDIYVKLEQFLAKQKEGYQALVDPATGLFYGYYDIASKKYATYHNGSFGNEVRASIPFLIAYYDLPASVWNNLYRENTLYRTQSGEWLETFKTFDGGAFQYFWPLLTAPEESLDGMAEFLQNALTIFIDHMEKNHLAGFVSASSLPWGGYSGKIGIPELKQTSDAVAENIASVYALGAAYRLNPALIIQKLAAIEAAFPQLMSPAMGFYDAMAQWGSVSYNFYAIDKGSFLLGLMGKGGDDFQSFMQKRGLWQKYLDISNAPAGPLSAASANTSFDIREYLKRNVIVPLEVRKKKKSLIQPIPKPRSRRSFR